MNHFDKLVKSIKKDDAEKVAQILQESTLNINELDPKSGKCVLQIAMQTQNTNIFTMLITYPGIDLQRLSKDGESPIQTAIILNSFYFVQKLLGTGEINPKRKNINHQTALQVAVKNRTSSDIIKKLIQFKFDINQPVNKYGSLANLALANNQLDNFFFLLNYGTQKGDKKDIIKINQIDDNDNTCLIIAVTAGFGDAVMAILLYISQDYCLLTDLEKQFFINAQNKQGNTALHIACLKNLQTLITIIETKGKSFGLDLTLRNKKGQTIDDIKIQTQKQRFIEKKIKEKQLEQKRIHLREKEQEKLRKREEEERFKTEQKKKKKEEELFLQRQAHYQKQLTHNKTKWAWGIGLIAIFAIMYLVILNSIQSKQTVHI